MPSIFHRKTAKKSKVDIVLLGQIRSFVVKKIKKMVFQWGFFIFCMKYIFTSKKVIEIPEWKLKTKLLARNTIFEGNYDKKCLPILGQK